MMCFQCCFRMAEVKYEEVGTEYARFYATQEQCAWNDDMASILKPLLVGIDQAPVA